MEEKIIIINLRKKLIQSPVWKRKPRAIRFLREIFKKRTKAKKIIIDENLNKEIWKVKDLAKIRIKMIKLDDKTVRLEKI
ncbi:MAG: 50S ribosomal protein L31e [Candidatus Aenigmatarchaeota archaeon]